MNDDDFDQLLMNTFTNTSPNKHLKMLAKRKSILALKNAYLLRLAIRRLGLCFCMLLFMSIAFVSGRLSQSNKVEDSDWNETNISMRVPRELVTLLETARLLEDLDMDKQAVHTYRMAGTWLDSSQFALMSPGLPGR